MSTPAEQFAIELGRASKRAAKSLRHVRGQDRDDVLSSAILYCWENRATFNAATMSLESWFDESVQTVRKDYRKRLHHAAPEQLAQLMSTDDPSQDMESEQAARFGAAELTTEERTVFIMLNEGYSFREIRRQLGGDVTITRRMVNNLRKLRERLPDPRNAMIAKRGEVAGDIDNDQREPAPIDHEIEKMLRRPATERADCPVCWRCMWYVGIQPRNYQAPRHEDTAVRDAVHATELRKIAIAGGVETA